MSKTSKTEALARKHVGEKHGKLTIIAVSQKEPNGYLYYYWARCECGNIKRFRYDQVRRAYNCGLCEDFTGSMVIHAVKERSNNGK